MRDQPSTDLDQVDLAEAARRLRALVEALPPTTARDRATARRIQGAAVPLETLAGRGQERSRPGTARHQRQADAEYIARRDPELCA